MRGNEDVCQSIRLNITQRGRTQTCPLKMWATDRRGISGSTRPAAFRQCWLQRAIQIRMPFGPGIDDFIFKIELEPIAGLIQPQIALLISQIESSARRDRYVNEAPIDL